MPRSKFVQMLYSDAVARRNAKTLGQTQKNARGPVIYI